MNDVFIFHAACRKVASIIDLIDAYCYMPTRFPCHKMLGLNERFAYKYIDVEIEYYIGYRNDTYFRKRILSF